VGGGDTENVIDELGVSDKFFFISLAGGAMLDFLANETLPGIEALNEN
jgi:phosphoglycerate kinase